MSTVTADAIHESPVSANRSLGKQTVDPYNVRGEVDEDGNVKAIDYDKLIAEFGTKRIDQALLERFERVTGHRPHRFMRRGIVFSHRDLELILDRYEKGEPFFLYTGRGPSSDSMHIGHTIPFSFTKWLSEVFNMPLVIMLTDDEKFLFGEKRTIKEVKHYARENSRDIIACGFDAKKTFIFSDIQFMGGAFYENVLRVAKMITLNQSRAIFGSDGSIPCAIDQDPYFRMTRDVAARLHIAKPSLIHARFLDALQGPGSKMSASVDSSAIFMSDTSNQIQAKINKYAYSGGQETAEEHREKGGNPDVDVSYQYLKYFMEDDDELERIYVGYRRGDILTGQLKATCIKYLQEYVQRFQDLRSQVTMEVVDEFMAVRPLTECHGNPKAPIMLPIRAKSFADRVGEGHAADDGRLSKSQLKKIEKEKQIAAKKAAKAAEKEATKAENMAA